jgi:hypothetical protein
MFELVRRATALTTVVALLSATAVAQEAPPPAQPPAEQPPAQPPAQRAPAQQPPAQQPPAEQPPPGYAPPPGYGQQQGYPPNYNYGYPPGQYGPAEMDYEEGEPIPEGYYVDTKIRKGMVIGGAVTLGALWILSVLAGAIAVSIEEAEEVDGFDDDDISTSDAAMLMIPVAGPFISIWSYNASAAGAVPLIFDGVGQSAGLVLLIVGLTAQEKVLKRSYAGGTLTPAPIVSKDHMGVGLTGTF